MNNEQRYLQVDGMRSIGLIFVLLFHFGYRYFELYGEKGIPFFSYLGQMGVALFFTISACMLSNKPMVKNGYANMLREIYHKIERIWLPYALAVLIIFFTLRQFPLEGRDASLTDLVLNLFFINGFVGTAYVDSSHWYMTYQLCLIIFMTILRYTRMQRKIGYGIWLIVNTILMKTTFSIGILEKLFSQIVLLSGGQYAGCMVAGILIMLLFKEKNIRNYCGTIIMLIGSLGHTFYFLGGEIGIFCICCYILLYFSLSGKIKLLQGELIIKLSTISFCVYLVHQNIGYIILKKLNMNSNFSIFWGILSVTISALLEGYILNGVINKLRTRLIKPLK